MTTLPTIHLNGTSKQELLDGYTNALRAVEDATRALRAVEFNSRDYYPQGDKAWSSALLERESQFEKLYQIRKQLNDVVSHLLDA